MKKENTQEVFLDLEKFMGFSEEDIGKYELSRYEADLKGMGVRWKEIDNLGISYSTASVKYFHKVKSLYVLGFFEFVIMLCRSISEYLAYELFVERANIEADRETIEKLAESLDCRKIVNDFLYSDNEIQSIITKTAKSNFNKIYDIGNNWVHPKLNKQQKNVDATAKETLLQLRELLHELRNILSVYDIVNGRLTVKKESKQKRPMRLA